MLVVDEAHNLLDTISAIHTVSVSGAQVSKAHWQVSQYQLKYAKRLSAKNLMHIKQLQFFLSCLLKTMGLSAKATAEPAACVAEDEKVYKVGSDEDLLTCVQVA